MSEVCEECPYKERLLCKTSFMLPEDVLKLRETKTFKEIILKNSVKTKKGVDELYQYTLALRREGHYDAVVFTNFCCPFCTECNLSQHMRKGYTIVSNRKLYRCVGLIGIQPGTDEFKAFILL